MPDALTTIIVAAGGAIASRDILNKLLGPTAEYLGGASRELVERAAKNMAHILQVTIAKLKSKVNEQGQVNSRVLKGVWDEGPFIEDVFSAEYFAGILASARTSDGRDDTALPMLALVKSLSADQLRLHFVIYYLVATHPLRSKGAEESDFWQGLELEIPEAELLDAMQFEGIDAGVRLLLAINGLIDEQLIGNDHAVRICWLSAGKTDSLTDDGLFVTPNRKGASLFLRSLGSRGVHPEVITSVKPDYSLSDAVKSAVQLPKNASFRRRIMSDAVNLMQSCVTDKLEELELELDDVKNQVEELDSKLDEIEGDDSNKSDT